MSPVERAVALAVEQHAGQVDKQGRPYILHVLRVVGNVSLEAECSEDALVVAALHDVIEDSPRRTDLDLTWLSGSALTALYLVTRTPDERYTSYIKRLLPNAIARLVKVADLRDNLEPSRLSGLPASDKDSLSSRYMNAWRMIDAYEDALAVVDRG